MILVVKRKVLFFLFVFELLVSGCRFSEKPSVEEITGRTMGTTYSVKYVDTGITSKETVKKRIERDLIEISRQMSTYIEDSEISLLNRAKAQEKQKVSAWLAHNLKLAIELAIETEGFYDPTIGPLVNLWGFGPRGRIASSPKPEEIKRARSIVGFEKVQLQQEEGGWFVTKSIDGVYIDLSSIAKGFAVDVVSDALLRMKIFDHLVEIGGELKAQGKKGAERWRVAIERPQSIERAVQEVLPLEGRALATSGSYRNFFISGGASYSHMLDPKKGLPVQNDLISVSVVSKDCARADALATALMALGKNKAMKFVKEKKIAAYFIMVDERQSDGVGVFMSDQFAKLQKISGVDR